MHDDINQFAVVADVHGNSWALQAVLMAISDAGIDTIVNLGDCVYGPLDPAGSADLLMEHCTFHIAGNQDRILSHPTASIEASATFRFVTERLEPRHVEWLRGLPKTQQIGDIFCCHGTPTSDETYLLENVTDHGVHVRESGAIMELLDGCEQSLVLCGHTHVPRTVWLQSEQLVVNPGSVGLPAYTDEAPYTHGMEAGSPHARFAVVSQTSAGWDVLHRAVSYDWMHAAQVARRNGRDDWAEWITYGRYTHTRG